MHFVHSFCVLQKHHRNFADNFSHFYQKGLPGCYISRKTVVKQKNTSQLLEAKKNCYTKCETFILTQVSVSHWLYIKNHSFSLVARFCYCLETKQQTCVGESWNETENIHSFSNKPTTVVRYTMYMNVQCDGWEKDLKTFHKMHLLLLASFCLQNQLSFRPWTHKNNVWFWAVHTEAYLLHIATKVNCVSVSKYTRFHLKSHEWVCNMENLKIIQNFENINWCIVFCSINLSFDKRLPLIKAVLNFLKTMFWGWEYWY